MRLSLLAPLLALSFVSRTALATSAPGCFVGGISPGEGSSVPANAPALAAFNAADALRVVGITPFPDGELAVAPDPTDPATALLVPSHPFDPGARYQVTLAPTCAPDTFGTYRFEASGAVALPTAIGAVVAGDPNAVTVAPTPEIVAYQAVTRFELRVNGRAWTSTRYGDAVPELSRGRLTFAIPVGSILDQPASAPLCAAGSTDVVHVGVELRAHVAGAASDPPPLAVSDVAFDCSRAAAVGTGPAAAPSPAASSSSSSGGGCNVGRSERGPFAFVLGAAALTALARRRGSRRSHRRHPFG